MAGEEGIGCLALQREEPAEKADPFAARRASTRDSDVEDGGWTSRSLLNVNARGKGLGPFILLVL